MIINIYVLDTYIYSIHGKYSVTLGFMKFMKKFKIYKTTFIRQLRRFILDIEHTPYYIALDAIHNHKVIY